MKNVQVCTKGDSPSFSQQSCLPAVHPMLSRALFSMLVLTIKHLVGQKVGQLKGGTQDLLSGVLRALPVSCCALSFHQISLFWGQNVCHKGHTQTHVPSALVGPTASSEQVLQKLPKPLKHRGRVGSAQGMAGAAPQVRVDPQTPPGWTWGDALDSAPCTAPAAPPWASLSSVYPPTWLWLLSLQPRQC